jgi:hypothetical protein
MKIVILVASIIIASSVLGSGWLIRPRYQVLEYSGLIIRLNLQSGDIALYAPTRVGATPPDADVILYEVTK